MKKRQVTTTTRRHSNRALEFVRVLMASIVVAIQLVVPVAPVFADEVADAVEEQDEVTSDPAVNDTPESSDAIETSEDEEASVDAESVDVETITDIIAQSVEPTVVNDTPSSNEEPDSVDEATDVTTLSESDETESDTGSSNEGEINIPDTEDATTLVTLVEDGASTSEDISSDETATSSENEVVPDEVISDEVVESVDVITDDTSLTPTPETVSEEVGTTTATSTEVTVVQSEVHTVGTDESKYSFGSDECARVADGSFYCSKEADTKIVLEDRVYAGPDVDGDSEIFIDKDGISRQITHNLADDVAPFYDAVSETIVWHRLVDARYQIISLDLETLLETQLTFDSYNNMQPTRFGDLTVWQGWVGNDWEIVMRDGGEIVMLTDNLTHDVGARINGEYIIWQSEEADGWKVRVYNTSTRQIETIDDADGASIENPRLLLVYDAKHENGDIETRGYDLDSKENVALNSEAPVLPNELPDPDQTGEDRALITAATQLKPKTDEEEEGEPEIVPVVPEGDTGTSTPVTEGDVVVPPYEEDADPLPPVIDSEESLPVEDLVIPQLMESVEEVAIDDLVIPPFVETIVDPDDSQTEVAKTE